jgi:predicted O-linked N-acetylglucosamine transferase (SPINDLY family)
VVRRPDIVDTPDAPMTTAAAPDDLLARAHARFQAGDLAQARALLETLLAAVPEHPAGLHQLGVLLLTQGDAAGAAARLDAAARLAPRSPVVHYHRSLALKAAGRLDDAAASCEQALALNPDLADAQLHLGNVRLLQDRLEDALAAYQAAVRLRPTFVAAHTNAGTVLQRLKRWGAAVAAHREAVRLDPRHGQAWQRLAAAAAATGDLTGALDAYDQALALAPADAAVLDSAVHLRQMLCAWDGLPALQARLLAAVEAGGLVRPFSLMSLDSTLAQKRDAARRWAAAHTAGVSAIARPPADATDRIAVAYLSSDLHEHPAAYNLAGVLEHHDRDRFRIVVYSIGPAADTPTRRRIRAAGDAFHDLSTLDDEGAARRIADDGIDVLVDFTGHTGGARPGILARRPAPVQVNWLGFTGTLGAPFIDYIVVDPVVVPPADAPWFDEQIARLPHCYYPSDRRRAGAPERPGRASLGLPERGLVLCCFNASYKITAECFAIWMRVLAAVPDSVLWLLAYNETTTGNLRAAARGHGVDPARLVFAPSAPLPVHLARQPQADLFLDTWPYGAHTTGIDALWSGVPMLTCHGAAFPGRVGASMLRALDMPDLIAASPAEYAAQALALARDPAALRALRARLAATRDRAPLFDTARFTADLERAFAAMATRQRAGLAPAPFDLTDV